MAAKMFFMKVPADTSEQDIWELRKELDAIADRSEQRGERWGFAIIPQAWDPMAHVEVLEFLRQLLKVVADITTKEKLLAVIERAFEPAGDPPAT